MKRLITCAGLVAFGVGNVDAQPVGEPSATKPWSVSAKLRGFYDSNNNTVPDHPSPGFQYEKIDGWGFSIAPSLAANLLKDQTTLSVRYDFDLRWYEARPEEEIDMYHKAVLNFEHRFSERYRVEVYDQFVYSDEPAILESGQQSTFFRTEGNNLRNYGGFGFFGSFTENWGYRVGYENTLYDYEQEGAGSWSALLDRMENKGTIDFRRVMASNSVALVGYSYMDADYDSDDFISPTAVGPKADFRNSRNHFGFLGWDYDLTSQMDFKIRGGVQAADYYNADDSPVKPYADALVSYRYREGSQVQLGVKTGMIATDVALSANVADPGVILGAQGTTTYAGISHRLSSNLQGQVRGMWQASEYFGGGAYDGEWDMYYSVDAGLIYTINTHVAFDVGYLWDRLDSDLPSRSYSRDRFYLGVRATY